MRHVMDLCWLAYDRFGFSTLATAAVVVIGSAAAVFMVG